MPMVLSTPRSSDTGKSLQSLYGADILTWDDLDLRNDLNGVAALTAARDLVISFFTFGAEFAATLGVADVMLFITRMGGTLFPQQHQQFRLDARRPLRHQTPGRAVARRP